MISCLVLFHPTITNLTKCRVLRYMFYKEDYKIEVIQKDTVLIFLKNVEKESVYESASYIETNGIHVGYGFGPSKNKAKQNALHKLDLVKQKIYTTT